MDRTSLKSILLEQMSEIDRIRGDSKVVERSDAGFWRSHMDNDLIKTCIGARRAGKTVFSHILLKETKYAYANFDDENLSLIDSKELNNVLEALFEIHGNFDYLLLDEVQNVAGWELFVNRLQRQGIRTVVTGSNAKLLSSELSTHLTGRHLKIEVLPFSFSEFLAWNGGKVDPDTTRGRAELKNKLTQYIETGGFPEVVRNPEIRNLYLTSLYQSVITKDIVARHGIRYVRTFREMASSVLSNYSNLITFNKLARVHGFGPHTAKNYVEYMADSYIICLVDKYSAKPREVANSPKKVYSIDTGIVKVLAIGASENRGRLLENMAFLQLRRRRALDPTLEFYYWRDYQDREVDFVIKRGASITELIQVTSVSGHDEVQAREVAGLMKASELLRCKNLTVLTWDLEDTVKKDGRTVRYVPMYKWLLGRE
ncbi:MAG: ATP-binding protein [Candidatus Thermoplasmatota archaeon]|nr:ATP-binding protein [Candidatus Thermoplasmatota archaeon]MBU4071520.1 ATP-binding protein [Candidatus Thermoplasmatota archaeon]MBU4144713.1 ATP-binding protein [Candidatus Thermoplasmatota archaeon]MBU4592692.1 ATP-binding protein [Candidatus Thermoplasmatota archaeon]